MIIPFKAHKTASKTYISLDWCILTGGSRLHGGHLPLHAGAGGALGNWETGTFYWEKCHVYWDKCHLYYPLLGHSFVYWLFKICFKDIWFVPCSNLQLGWSNPQGSYSFAMFWRLGLLWNWWVNSGWKLLNGMTSWLVWMSCVFPSSRDMLEAGCLPTVLRSHPAVIGTYWKYGMVRFPMITVAVRTMGRFCKAGGTVGLRLLVRWWRNLVLSESYGWNFAKVPYLSMSLLYIMNIAFEPRFEISILIWLST